MKIQGFISIFGIAGLLVTLLLTRGSLKAAQDQAKSAKTSADAALEAIRADNRPWFNFDVKLTDGLKWDDSGVTTSIKVPIKNSGSSPAIGVRLGSETFPFLPPDESVVSKIRNVLEMVRESNADTIGIGTIASVFPKDGRTEEFNLRVSVEALAFWQERMELKFGEGSVQSGLIF